MAYIRRLPSKKWQATVRGLDGKKHSKTDPLKSVVRAWANGQEAAIARRTWRDPRAGEVTVREFTKRWLAARIVEAETARGDRSVLRTHIAPAWDGWRLADVTKLDVQSWVKKMEKSGVGTQAIRRAVNLLASMFEAAVDGDVITANPCRRIRTPEIARKPPQWFTRLEAASIIEQLAPSPAAMVGLGFYTGLRWQELAGLHVERIDWARGALHVVEVMAGGEVKEYPKSRKSRREVPVPDAALAVLSEFVGDREKGLVFTTYGMRKGRSLRDSNWRRDTWWPAVEAANEKALKDGRKLVPLYPPHSMRHSCASWLVQDGVPLYDVQALLGHESFQTTQRYAHLQPDHHSAVMTAWQRLGAHLAHEPSGIAAVADDK